MYISHKYKIAFIRTPRCAGSSICEFLIKNLDDTNAIYTPVEDSNILGTVSEAVLEKYRPYGFYSLSLNDLDREHLLTYKQMKADKWKVFSVIRNPLDVRKSLYYFYKKHWDPKANPSLEHMKTMKFGDRKLHWSIYQANQLKVGPDRIYGEFWLYEYIESHLKSLCDELEIEIKHELPRHKANQKPEIDFDYDLETVLETKYLLREEFNLYSHLRTTAYETDTRHYSETQ